MKTWMVVALVIIGLLVIVAWRNFLASKTKKDNAGKLPDDRYPLW